MADMRTQMIAALFQPAPGGYVYRQPFHWSFRPRPHYLVNEEQKDALVAITMAKRPILAQVIMWTALCAMVALACLAMWAITGHDDPTGVDIVGMIALTASQIFIAFAGLRWWKLRELRPLLGTLTRTDLRIEPAQIRAAAVNAMSVKQLVVAGVSSVFAASAALVSGALQLALHHQTGLIWIAHQPRVCIRRMAAFQACCWAGRKSLTTAPIPDGFRLGPFHLLLRHAAQWYRCFCWTMGGIQVRIAARNAGTK